jgi:hypothetical protein
MTGIAPLNVARHAGATAWRPQGHQATTGRAKRYRGRSDAGQSGAGRRSQSQAM